VDEQQALSSRRVERAESLRSVVEQQDCDLERERGGVGDEQERALEPVSDVSRRVREDAVPDQHVPELAGRKEEGECERIVAVTELAGEQGDSRRDHQRAHRVSLPARPGDEP
jgi:hypothetical protein